MLSERKKLEFLQKSVLIRNNWTDFILLEYSIEIFKFQDFTKKTFAPDLPYKKVHFSTNQMKGALENEFGPYQFD